MTEQFVQQTDDVVSVQGCDQNPATSSVGGGLVGGGLDTEPTRACQEAGGGEPLATSVRSLDAALHVAGCGVVAASATFRVDDASVDDVGLAIRNVGHRRLWCGAVHGRSRVLVNT